FVCHSPDIYLAEFQKVLGDRLGVEVHQSTLWTSLQWCRFTMKKVMSKFDGATQLSSVSILPFAMIMGANTLLSRQYLLMKVLLIGGHQSEVKPGHSLEKEPKGNVSLLEGSTLAIDSVIHAKIVEESFTGELFYEIIEGVLDYMQPFPQPKSVIVMDNAHIHKDPKI
ncbi:hypothetical protein C8R44DRAFT_597376, partial [Mycena epipterygia]